MSLLDLASLVLAPTATKEGKVYSAIPDTGDGDLSFTRSNDTATRVNSAGLIEKVRGNLLLQSNTFDTTWTTTNTSVTGGQSGYDGSSDAWLLTRTNTSGYLWQSVTLSGVQTFSFRLKKGTLDWVVILTNNTSNNGTYFNLNTGAKGTDGSNVIDSSITSLGGDWYQCIVTLNVSTTAVYVYPAAGDLDVSGTSGNILIQDAQLEQGLVAQSYIETTTTAVYEGITDDVPRVDYSGGGCPSLLLEGQRTNLVTQSEYFGGWDVYRGSLTANDATSPEGVDNAYRYEENSDTGQHFVRKTISMTSSTTYTASAFVKADEITSVKLGSSNTGNWNASATFNLSNGTVSFGSGIIENYGNGWYRCIVTAACTTTATIGVEITTSSGVGSSGDGLYIYGAMVEAGSYVSSYIPTYGAVVTRGADACSKAGISSLIGQTEGTLFVEASTLENGANNRITISDNTIDNRVSIEWDIDADTIKGFIGVGGNVETTSHNQTNQNKIALLYTTSVAKLFINGSLIDTDSTSIPTMSGMNRIDFSNYGGSVPFFGNVKQVIYFPTALTDAECIELTK